MKYSRQERLFFIPETFQEEVENKKILLIGCGGVGSVLAELLVRGGFLDLIIVDNDVIDYTNLQRQNYYEIDVGKPKATTLKEHLRKVNVDCNIDARVELVSERNLPLLAKNARLVIDATDNFHTRRIINDYCEKENKDWLYNGAIKTELVCCFFYGKDKLFNKVFSQKNIEENTCDVGVLASTTFSAAAIAYNQVIRYFLGIKEYKMIKMDIWTNKLFEVNIK